jgi:hypothetical protein
MKSRKIPQKQKIKAKLHMMHPNRVSIKVFCLLSFAELAFFQKSRVSPPE